MNRTRGFLRVLASDRSGLGLVEVVVATGILGVVIAGVMGVMGNINRTTRSGTIISSANMVQQHIQNLLSQEVLCPQVLRTSSGTPARFNLSADTTTVETSSMTNRLHTIRMPSGLVIAQHGQNIQGIRLREFRIRRIDAPIEETTGVFRTPFEIQLVLEDTNPANMRSLGAQEIVRPIQVSIITAGGATPAVENPRAVVRCNGAAFSGEQACSATGGTFEGGECRYNKLIAAQSAVSKAALDALISTGGIATDRPIITQQNIQAGGSITSSMHITANGLLYQGVPDTRTVMNMNTSAPDNLGANIQGFRGMTSTWDSDFAYFGLQHVGVNRKDTVLAFGDDADDRLIIGHKRTNQALAPMARFLPFAYPSDGGIGLGGLDWGGDRNVAALEIPGALVFGRRTPIAAGDPNSEALHGAGYLAVAGDIEIGSLKQNITNIALFNRGFGAHMHMTGGRIHSLGPVSEGGQPGFFVVHQNGQPASAVLQEKENGGLAGAGILLLRGNKPDITNPAPVRLKIDAETMGPPFAGAVLRARNDQGDVDWAPGGGSIQMGASALATSWYLQRDLPNTNAWNVLATFTASMIGPPCAIANTYRFEYRVGSGAWNTLESRLLHNARDNANDQAGETWTRDYVIPVVAGANLQLQIVSANQGACPIESSPHSIKFIAVPQ